MDQLDKMIGLIPERFHEKVIRFLCPKYPSCPDIKAAWVYCRADGVSRFTNKKEMTINEPETQSKWTFKVHRTQPAYNTTAIAFCARRVNQNDYPVELWFQKDHLAFLPSTCESEYLSAARAAIRVTQGAINLGEECDKKCGEIVMVKDAASSSIVPGWETVVNWGSMKAVQKTMTLPNGTNRQYPSYEFHNDMDGLVTMYRDSSPLSIFDDSFVLQATMLLGGK